MPRSLIVCLAITVISAAALLVGCPDTPINPLPVARFVATPVSGQPPLTVQFTDVSTAGAAPIQSWVWRFSDGSTSTRLNPSKTFFKPGLYTVSLTVTNSYGEHMTTRENFIEVQEPASFLSIGPSGGTVQAQGVVLSVPAGALEETVVYGVAPQEEGFALNGVEPLLLASKAYTITHSGSSDALYAVSPTGELEAATLEIPFFQEAVSSSDQVAGKVIILARQPDGFTIPIIGEVRDNRVIAEIAGLPASAQYAVVLREEGILGTESVDVKDARTLNTAWESQWRVALSLKTLQQLTALRIGSISNTLPYDRRDYTNDELQETGDLLVDEVKNIHRALRDSGLRRPALVTADDAYTTVFYNMNPTYTTMYEDFREQVFAYTAYGSLVIDPMQLITVSKHNAAIYKEDPLEALDYNQEFSFINAFTQALFKRAFMAYEYPALLTASPTDKDESGDASLVDFLAGLQEGLAVWFGQWADGMETARGFDENEYLLLTTPLLAPYDEEVPGYAFAGQDLFAYLRKAYTPADPLTYITHATLPDLGLLERLRVNLENLQNELTDVTYDDGMETLLASLNTVFSAYFDATVGEVFFRMARERGVENGDAALLRPSDENRDLFRYIPERFSESVELSETLTAPTDILTFSYEDNEALAEIPALSARPVIIPINPLATEIELLFETDAWEEEESLTDIDIAVYKPGFPAKTLSEDGYDTDDDDIPDTVLLESFQEDQDACYAEIALVIVNKSHTAPYSVSLTAATFSELASNSESLALNRYLNACDPEYTYSLEQSSSLGASGVKKYVLLMNSGVWRSDAEVNYDAWQHYLTILEPPQIASDCALLLTTGGAVSASPLEIDDMLQSVALASRSVIVILQGNPNQPLLFEEQGKLSEDALLAMSFEEYLNGYEEGRTDRTWPALLPMTRAILRAMDATQYFMEYEKPGAKVEIERFALSGVAKRGWAAWLAAASNPLRVCALMPVAADILNLKEQMAHQYEAYGEYGEALESYVDAEFIGPVGGNSNRIAQAAGASLMAIIDPINYVDQLEMPKFLLSAGSDQFTLPDASRYFRDQLPGETRFYVAPNIDHGLNSSTAFEIDDSTFATLAAYYASMTRGIQLPDYTWSFGPDNQIVVETTVQPSKVTLWEAENTESCDFRLNTIGASWIGTELEGVCGELTKEEKDISQAEGETEGEGLVCDLYHYEVEIDKPSLGWKAFYVEIVFPGPDPKYDIDYAFTTPIQITPDL